MDYRVATMDALIHECAVRTGASGSELLDKLVHSVPDTGRQPEAPFVPDLSDLVELAVAGKSRERADLYRVRGPEFEAGYVALVQGNADRAIQKLGIAARKSPSSFIVRLELGRALSLAGDFEKARGELDRALRLSPADAEATNLLAAVQIELGQFEEAATLLQPLADGNQAPPEASFLLGRALAGQGKRGLALEKLREAIERDQSFHDAFFEAGTLVREEGDFQSAFGLLRQACSLAPEEVAYNRALASLVLEQNLEVETGLAACDRLMVTDEENRWQYLAWIAELYLRRGWKREAVDPLRKAIALAPAAMTADRQDLEKRLAELESGSPFRA